MAAQGLTQIGHIVCQMTRHIPQIIQLTRDSTAHLQDIIPYPQREQAKYDGCLFEFA
jgi:hypothetical protein